MQGCRVAQSIPPLYGAREMICLRFEDRRKRSRPLMFSFSLCINTLREHTGSHGQA